DVLAHGEFHIDGRGHRLDALHIDLIELLDPFQNAVQLPGERLEALLRHGEAGEARDLAHGVFVYGHEMSLERKREALSTSAESIKGRGSSPLSRVYGRGAGGEGLWRRASPKRRRPHPNPLPQA